MTFEEWYKSNMIGTGPIEREDMLDCWNAALKSEQDRCAELIESDPRIDGDVKRELITKTRRNREVPPDAQ